MMGGKSTRKNAVGENTSSRFQFDSLSFEKKLMHTPMNAPRNTTTMLSGRYWHRVSSMVCINNIPIAMMHNTKNIAIDVLCSCSTAFRSIVSVTTVAASVVALSLLFVLFTICVWFNICIAVSLIGATVLLLFGFAVASDWLSL